MSKRRKKNSPLFRGNKTGARWIVKEVIDKSSLPPLEWIYFEIVSLSP
jgi:hypothetical protein